MTESQFIEDNKNDWERLEKLLDLSPKDPDALQSLFVKVSSDLAYATTYYPNRSVRLYLNKLTQRVFDSIEKDKKRTSDIGGKMINFFRYVLPYELYNSRKELLLSLAVFVLAVLIGIISTAHSDNFTALILGDGYVSMTEANINKGDPMAVYKDADKINMFFGITLNNIRVSFNAFIGGIFAGIGTFYLLLFNGIMLGTFQYFFYQKGLLATSFFTIWIHGTIEISAIIIAGGAGFVLGRGLMLPGTLSRGTSLLIASKRAVRIIIGCVPLFIIAGVLESFVTRLTDLPLFVKAMIILLSAIFIVGMYVVYPWWLHKRVGDKLDYAIAPPRTAVVLDTSVQKLTVSEIMSHALTVYRSVLGDYLSIVLKWIAPLLIGTLYIWLKVYGISLEDVEELSPLLFGNTILGPYLFFVFWVILVFLVVVSVWLYQRVEHDDLKLITVLRKNLIWLLFATGVPLAIAYFVNGDYALLSLLVITPQLAIIGMIDSDQNQKFGKSFSIWPLSLLFIVFISIFLFLVVSTFDVGIGGWIIKYLTWHDIFFVDGGAYSFVRSLFTYLIAALFLPVYIYSLIYVYQSYKAGKEAVDLRERFRSFGQESKIFEPRV